MKIVVYYTRGVSVEISIIFGQVFIKTLLRTTRDVCVKYAGPSFASHTKSIAHVPISMCPKCTHKSAPNGVKFIV